MATLQEGSLSLQRGRPREAQAVFERILQVEPDNAEAQYLLGVCLSLRKDFVQALPWLAKAAANRPHVAAFHDSHAAALAALAQFVDAEAACHAALRAEARHQPALLRLAGLLVRRGAYEEALIHYRAALRIDPACGEALHMAAATLLALHRPAESLRLLQHLLALCPTHEAALANRVTALCELGRTDEAIACGHAALQNATPSASLRLAVSHAFLLSGRLDEAERHCRAVLEGNPGHTAALARIARIQLDRGHLELAETRLRALLADEPNYARARVDLGIALGAQGRSMEARAAFEAVITGTLRADDQAVLDARFNRSLLLLAEGEWEEGFAEYEFRWQVDSRVKPTYGGPEWNGSNVAGRHVLLYTEQGLGDAIQFVRYAELLKAAGAIVLVASQPSLAPLFRRVNGVSAAVSRDESLPEYDFHISLMSLPRLLGTTVENVPNNVPYLRADPQLVDAWAARLRSFAGLRVGLVWAGSGANRNDRTRSVQLDRLAPLCSVAGCQFFSLQIGPQAAQSKAGWGEGCLIDLGPETGTLEAATAAIANLDLLISVDSALAHLAGAIGKSVWVMLPFVADWRWLRSGDRTPWYPSMRLFRQTEPGDWTAVVSLIAKALAEEVASHSSQ